MKKWLLLIMLAFSLVLISNVSAQGCVDPDGGLDYDNPTSITGEYSGLI